MTLSSFGTRELPEPVQNDLLAVAKALQKYPPFFLTLTAGETAVRQRLQAETVLRGESVYAIAELIHNRILAHPDLVGGREMELRSFDLVSGDFAPFAPWHLDRDSIEIIVINGVPTQVAVGTFHYDMRRYLEEEQFKEVQGQGFDRAVEEQLQGGALQRVDAPLLTGVLLKPETVHRMSPIPVPANPDFKRVTLRLT